MKKFILIALILCKILQLEAQSEITFTIDEARLIHKQQIRLFFCDSTRVILTSKLNTYKEQTSLLNQAISAQKQDVLALENYNLSLLKEFDVLKTNNKKLAKRNNVLKIGFVSVSAVALLVFIIK